MFISFKFVSLIKTFKIVIIKNSINNNDIFILKV
jgi:hypothetical protein